MKQLYMWCWKFLSGLPYLKYTGYHLPYLVVSLVLCSCWFCCERQDTVEPLVGPIQEPSIHHNESQEGNVQLVVEPTQEPNKEQFREYDDLLRAIPSGIHALPRLIVGQASDFAKGDRSCITPRPQDMTLDICSDADIEGDAWDSDTISKIKAHAKYQGKFSAIIFERIGVLPLYWGKYLQAFVAQPTKDIYQFPTDIKTVVDLDIYNTRKLGNRANRKMFYREGLCFYHALEKVQLSALQLSITHQTNLAVDPHLVTMVSTQKCLFQKNDTQQPQLEQVINSIAPAGNTILADYYELLAPGGLLIFSSSANGVNRYGGITVEHKGRRYTPFQDVDDPRLQAVYCSIFERAGFVDIQFYKDPYFAEEVILLVARKP